MWGHILTEASTQQNFNFGFSTYKSDILVHLSQWQYWWWFWFSIWWTLYYFIIIRVVTKRTFNFNVIMNTSIRGRGKWGDFLVALIPVSWCCNILINSNFILRMIEWQNEASLFVVRIQGKQWYWAYKYNSDTNYRLQNLFINVGHNNWFRTTTPSSRLFSYRNTTLIFIYEYEFKKIHKSILSQKGRDFSKINNLSNLTQSTENLSSNSTTNFNLNNFFKYNSNTVINLNNLTWSYNSKNNYNVTDLTENLSSITTNFQKNSINNYTTPYRTIHNFTKIYTTL
jgi:hypothetical protein